MELQRDDRHREEAARKPVRGHSSSAGAAGGGRATGHRGGGSRRRPGDVYGRRGRQGMRRCGWRTGRRSGGRATGAARCGAYRQELDLGRVMLAGTSGRRRSRACGQSAATRRYCQELPPPRCSTLSIASKAHPATVPGAIHDGSPGTSTDRLLYCLGRNALPSECVPLAQSAWTGHWLVTAPQPAFHHRCAAKLRSPRSSHSPALRPQSPSQGVHRSSRAATYRVPRLEPVPRLSR